MSKDLDWYIQNEQEMLTAPRWNQLDAQLGLGCTGDDWDRVFEQADALLNTAGDVGATSVENATPSLLSWVKDYFKVADDIPVTWLSVVAKKCLEHVLSFRKPESGPTNSTTNTRPPVETPVPKPPTWQIRLQGISTMEGPPQGESAYESPLVIRLSVLEQGVATQLTREPPSGPLYSYETFTRRVVKLKRFDPRKQSLFYYDWENTQWIDIDNQDDFSDAITQLKNAESTNPEDFDQRYIRLYVSTVPTSGAQDPEAEVGGSTGDGGGNTGAQDPEAEVGGSTGDGGGNTGGGEATKNTGTNKVPTNKRPVPPSGSSPGNQPPEKKPRGGAVSNPGTGSTPNTAIVIVEGSTAAKPSGKSRTEDEDENVLEDVEIDMTDGERVAAAAIAEALAAADAAAVHARTQAALASATQSKVLERIDERDWLDCCDFFGHDPNKRQFTDLVDVYGMKRKPQPHQALLVFWALRTFHTGLEGAVVSDDVGMGKTQSMLTLFVVMRHLALMWHEVDEAHSKKSSDHLPARALRPGTDRLVSHQKEGDQCPSLQAKKGWAYTLGHPCPCVHGSVLDKHKIRGRLGLFLTLAPSHLMIVWEAEFLAIMDPVTGLGHGPRDLGLQLCIAHNDKLGRDWANHFHRFPQQKKDEMTAHAKVRSAQVSANQGRGVWDVTGTLSNTRFCVVTTSHSVVRCLADKFLKSINSPVIPRGATRGRVLEQCVRLAFSCIVRDEFHLETADSSKTIVALKLEVNGNRVFRQGRPFIVPVSATPFGKSIGDILEYLELMRRGRDWRLVSHGTYARLGPASIEDMHKRFQRHQKSRLTQAKLPEGSQAERDLKKKKTADMDDLVEKLMSELSEVCTLVMIRRTAATSFFGYPICYMPPHEHLDKQVTLSPAWQALLDVYQGECRAAQRRDAERAAAARAAGQASSRALGLGNYHFKLRQMVTCPYLLRMWRRANAAVEAERAAKKASTGEDLDPALCAAFLNLTAAQAMSKGWLLKPLESLYATHINAIAASSPKLQEVGDRIVARRSVLDRFGAPVKEIFASNFATIAIILYSYLVKVLNIDPVEIALFHKEMPKKDCEELIAKFEAQPTTNPRYIIGTISVIGTGHTMVRGVHVTLMEPQYKSVDEDQLYGRISRIGQKNPKTYSYRLLTENNEIEQNIVVMSSHRRRQTEATT